MRADHFALPLPGHTAELSPGSVRPLRCLVYRPTVESDPERVLVAVHGISRNYRQQEEAFRPLAERLGLCLIVPLFDKEHYPGYQRLAAKPSQRRADRALSMMLLTWQAMRNLADLKMHLFGYSGGAQFSHRYAYLYPERIATLSVCSAGWYTLPSDEFRYPYGLKGWPAWLGRPKRDALVKLPLLGLVGEEDSARDGSLRKSDRLDREQGRTRIERARCWVESINVLKAEEGSGGALLQMMPGQAHDFGACAESGLMLPLIEQFIQRNRRYP